jgi:hypothetical protein
MLAKEYNEEPDDAVEYSFSTDDMQLFEERRQKRLSGERKTYNWNDAKNMVIGKIDNVYINSVFHTSRLPRYKIVISYMQ